MSFIRSSSSEKKVRVNLKVSASQSSQKSPGIFERFFNKSIVEKEKIEQSQDVISQAQEYQENFLLNLKLELVYTSNVLRQDLDHPNSHDIILQLSKCSNLIRKRLSESQAFIESLPLNFELSSQVNESLKQVIRDNECFDDWTRDLNTIAKIDQDLGQKLFAQLDKSAISFMSLVKSNVDVGRCERRRCSIDNWPKRSKSPRPEPSYMSRSRKQDQEFLKKVRTLDSGIVRPTPRPRNNFGEYQSNIDAITRADNLEVTSREPSDMSSLKAQNNNVLSTSITNKVMSTMNGEAIEPRKEFLSLNESALRQNNKKTTVNSRRSLPERDKNVPLPAVPVISTGSPKFKSPQIRTNYPSEEHYYRLTSQLSRERAKDATHVSQHPLRSPSLVSDIHQHTKRSSMLQSPVKSMNNHSDIASTSPTSLSHNSDDIVTSQPSVWTQRTPSTVSKSGDMQDDTDIVSRSLQNTDEYDKSNDIKRLSNNSANNTICLPISPTENKSISTPMLPSVDNDDTICNSEVKSDTEEYFEYFEIDGEKYRRKMKKRTVVEKIKIQKTVYAPLKSDGSGPDLSQFPESDVAILLNANEPPDDQDLKLNPEKPIFRRSSEDRFRVSMSMFIPYRDNIKRLTMNYDNDNKNDHSSKTPALLSNYMYRIGRSDFEEPSMDKRLSTQLLDDANSIWMKTSEFSLPHEKSKSICYFKKSSQKNEDGNTVHSAFHITKSRTVRMKPHDNETEANTDNQVPNVIPTITIGDDDYESDISIGDMDSRYDSCHPSTDDEKEIDSPSSQESLSAEQQETLSTTSTMDDSDCHDLMLDEPPDAEPTVSTRSPSPDSCFYPSSHSSFQLDNREQYSFILKESNPSQYLIFDDDAKPGECDIAGGPIDALIVYACDGEENFLFLGAFLDTYRTFIEPEDLISRLIVRYKFFRAKVPSDNCDSSGKRADSGYTDGGDDSVRMRKKMYYADDPEKKCIHILSLLLTIIGKLKGDLTENVNCQIQTFEKYLQEIHEEQWIQAIRNTIRTQKQAMEKDSEMVLLLGQLSSSPRSSSDQKSPTKEIQSPTKTGSSSSSNKMTILDFSSHEIAEQMTALDWGKYRDVELIEVLNLKDIANCKLPGVIEYAKHFQSVQYWTQSILLDPDKKTTSDRDRYCWKFLRIMKHLRKLNNFSSFIAILLGIQLLPGKKLFSKRIRSKIMEMDDYMKPTKFVGYKEDLKRAVAPCIPFLGIFYQDIVMLNIANPQYLDLDDISYASRVSNWSVNNSQHLSSIPEQCGPIINFWRSFKQYIFLKNCNKDQDKIRYSIKPDEKILQFLRYFQDRFDEVTIQRLAKEV